MQSYAIGYHWNGPDGVCPRLVDVLEVCGEYTRTSRLARNANWVLDYEFDSYGLYRVRSRRMPWRPRLPRTAHLYPPGTSYWEDTHAEQGYRHSAWICFADGAAAGLDAFVQPRIAYARFLDTQGQLGTLLHEAALVARRDGDEGFWLAQAVFYRILDLLHRAEHETEETYRLPHENETRSPEFAQTVDSYLRLHIRDRVTLADVARHVHVSMSTLSHRYRDETGRPPMARLIELRINCAKTLLTKGMPLKNIAYQLGVSDAFHLSRRFKRVTGTSPRIFRETQ